MRHRNLSSLLLAAVTAAGCGTTGENRQVEPGDCGQPDVRVVSAAVEEFVRTAQPRAYRFLLPVSGDSVLPDQARAALQMKGQTFLYPNDSAQRAAVLQRLSDIGEFTTMLVAYKGTRLVTEDSAHVSFTGWYVPIRGIKPAESTSAEVPFTCDVVWKLSRTVKKES